MPWSSSDYPASMANLEPKVRHKAIEIANAILKGGGDEGVAIATGIARAKELSRTAQLIPSDPRSADLPNEVVHPNRSTAMATAKQADESPSAEAQRAELETELSNDNTVQAVVEFLAAEGFDLAQTSLTEGVGRWAEASECATIEVGDASYLIFPDEDTAIEVARAAAQSDLEEAPATFTPSWLQGHIDMERLTQFLMSDVEEDIRNNPSANGWEGKWEVKITGPNGETESVEGVFDSESEADDAGYDASAAKGDDWGWTSEQLDGGEPDEDFVTHKAEEILGDPMGYLTGLYGEDEAAKKAVEWGGIDDDAAADAVALDGWQHFVASYDGLSHDLPSGGVWVRAN